MLRRALYHGSERVSQERGTPAWLWKMGRVSTDSRKREQDKRRHGGENKEGEFIWNIGDERGESVPSEGLGLSQIQRLCGQSGLRHADPNISMAFHSNSSFSCTWHVCGGLILTAPCTPYSRAQDPGWRSSSSLGYCQSPTREKRHGKLQADFRSDTCRLGPHFIGRCKSMSKPHTLGQEAYLLLGSGSEYAKQ